jgi:hypothetical protein
MAIKIFGERNTGTNAVRQMLIANSKSVIHPGTKEEMSELASSSLRSIQARIANKKVEFIDRMGHPPLKREQIIDKLFLGSGLTERWKHSATNVTTRELEEINDTKFILTVRHPLSWLVGLYKKPYHILVEKPDSIIGFSDLDWRTVGRENLLRASYKPLDLLEEKYKSYLSFMDKLKQKGLEYKVIKFEDFVVDQKGTFESLLGFMDRPSPKFSELIKSTKETHKDSKYYAFYYSNELWREEFPEINRINNTISKDLMSAFGY